jgi:molybdopterin-guanine dinucleotide biosynthesis protein A
MDNGERMWTAAILAGGQARRLGGRDKSALLVGATSILEQQLAMLRELTPHILIVGRPHPPTEHERVRAVPDRVPGRGALGGLYTALVEASDEQVVVLACDMPFLTGAFVSQLAAAGAADTDADVVLPCDAHGRHPLCASYRTRIAPALQRRIDAGKLRVLDAVDELRVRELGADQLAAYNPEGRLLLNVNTPEDYARAQQR